MQSMLSSQKTEPDFTSFALVNASPGNSHIHDPSRVNPLKYEIL